MNLYWRERRLGQRLILATDDEGEGEVEVGAVRQTPRGFDALAKTNTYDPGRAQKGFATMEEAKVFVESFHPWDLFGGDLDLEVESEVRPNPGDTSTTVAAEPGGPLASAETSAPTAAEPDESLVSAETPAPAAAEPGGPLPSAEPPAPASAQPDESFASAATPTPASAEPVQQADEKKQPRKRGWRIWERG